MFYFQSLPISLDYLLHKECYISLVLLVINVWEWLAASVWLHFCWEPFHGIVGTCMRNQNVSEEKNWKLNATEWNGGQLKGEDDISIRL